MKIIARLGLAVLTGGVSEGYFIGKEIGNKIIGKIEENEDKEIDNMLNEMDKGIIDVKVFKDGTITTLTEEEFNRQIGFRA